MDCLSYRRTFSLERQAFSQVARQVAEGSGWTTSTATDTRRACPRGMKALSCDAKLAGSKSPRKEKARFCRVVFFCRRLCDANIEVSPQPRQLSLRASPASRESELEGLQVLQAGLRLGVQRDGDRRRADFVPGQNVLDILLLETLRQSFELLEGHALAQLDRIIGAAHFSHLLCRVLLEARLAALGPRMGAAGSFGLLPHVLEKGIGLVFHLGRHRRAPVASYGLLGPGPLSLYSDTHTELLWACFSQPCSWGLRRPRRSGSAQP